MVLLNLSQRILPILFLKYLLGLKIFIFCGWFPWIAIIRGNGLEALVFIWLCVYVIINLFSAWIHLFLFICLLIHLGVFHPENKTSTFSAAVCSLSLFISRIVIIFSVKLSIKQLKYTAQVYRCKSDKWV